jgi:hypothetical protein
MCKLFKIVLHYYQNSNIAGRSLERALLLFELGQAKLIFYKKNGAINIYIYIKEKM